MAATNSVMRSIPANRRRRVRHRIQTPAYATFNEESKGAMLALHEIVDVSEDGVAIQCNALVSDNQRFDLCLDLADASGQIFTPAEAVWSDGSGRSGFRFSELPPASLFHLREWLFLNAMAGVANAEPEALAAVKSPMAEVIFRTDYTDTLAAVNAVKREVESTGSDLVAALDLIAARAQTLVRASGAAIALASADPDFMVCRASSGPDAPPVGARLQVGSGFSGECVSSGRLLRCDDTETDIRVDRENCRALGIRSILAAPVRVGEKVVGILEVFSPYPAAFGSDQSTVLMRLADMVLSAISRAADSANPAKAINPVTVMPSPIPFVPLPGSVLFASQVREPQSEIEKPHAEEVAGAGIRLPRSLLFVLICAAATIALALGFILAPWIQEKVHAYRLMKEQTVLASSRSPATTSSSPVATPKPAVDTATLEELQQLAATGDPAAENALGLRYATGEGVELNEKTAALWFTEAAEHGSVAAQSKLGSLYWVGRGVPQDLNKAYFWTVLARAAGDDGSKALATILASHMTRPQSSAIEQQAEAWFQQHQPTAKVEAGH